MAPLTKPAVSDDGATICLSIAEPLAFDRVRVAGMATDSAATQFNP